MAFPGTGSSRPGTRSPLRADWSRSDATARPVHPAPPRELSTPPSASTIPRCCSVSRIFTSVRPRGAKRSYALTLVPKSPDAATNYYFTKRNYLRVISRIHVSKVLPRSTPTVAFFPLILSMFPIFDTFFELDVSNIYVLFDIHVKCQFCFRVTRLCNKMNTRKDT